MGARKREAKGMEKNMKWDFIKQTRGEAGGIEMIKCTKSESTAAV